MRLLLDTHALIWWSGNSEQIGPMTAKAIGEAEAVFISAISVYEMSLKHALGKLPGVADLLLDLDRYLQDQGFEMLDLRMAHAELAGRLRLDHRDPFDRMLIAQALVENLNLVSNEEVFDQFGVRRLW